MNNELRDKVKDFGKIVHFLLALLIILTFSFYILGADQIAASLFFLVIGFVLFVILDKKNFEFSQEEDVDRFCISNKLINLFFFFTLFTSLVILDIQRSPFSRPILFFGFAALAFGSISMEIVSINEEKLDNLHIASILLKIVITGILYKWSSFTGVSSLNDDVSLHMIRVENIVHEGNINNMLGYSDMPFYHVLWAMSILILGANISVSRFLMAFISALGAFFMYVFSKNVIRDKKSSLYSALVFSFFTLFQRSELQTESLVFPIFFLPLLCFLFCSERRSFNDRLTTIILFSSLAFTHLYYSGLFVIFLTLFFMSTYIFQMIGRSDAKAKTEVSHLLRFCGALWVSRVVYSSFGLRWTVEMMINVILSPDLGTFEIEPAFLSAETTILQFLGTHLSELVFISLSTTSVLLLLKKIDTGKLLIIGPFLGFGLITSIGILIEGQKYLAWGISYRNFYLASLFLVFLGGYALRNFELISKRNKIVLPFLVLFTVLSFFSITSQQANRADPLFYVGEVPSPQPVLCAEIEMLGDFFSHITEGSSVLSDYRMLSYGNLLLVPGGEKIEPRTFSKPSLPELNEEYDYIIINMYSVEKGMIFCKVRKGLGIDRQNLLNKTEDMSKVWDSGPVEVFRKS